MKIKIFSISLFLIIFLIACAPQTTTQPSLVEPINTSTSTATDESNLPVKPVDATRLTYPIVDTNQQTCYDDDSVITCPQDGEAFSGQDGNYQGLAPAYQTSGNGTVTDLNTGLMWTQSPDINGDGVINAKDKLSFTDSETYAQSLDFAGYDDWRVPNIKELYSLMDFTGTAGQGDQNATVAPADAVPFIDTTYFYFAYGDASAGERYIDAQFASSTLYVSTTMNGDETMFGVNFADGRIKGYGLVNPRDGVEKTFYVYFVRGDVYGENIFVDDANGTISDLASGLTWLQADSGTFQAGVYGDGSMNWEEALGWCNALDYAGYSDWRLPNAKELHSIVDYSRSPDTTNSAAINPKFEATYLPNGINNNGTGNYAHYWSSTTHLDGIPAAARGVYFAFGEAQGVMNGVLMDVHGAGAQRSDIKSGDPALLPEAQGPQGDVQSIYNLARCVRGDAAAYTSGYTGEASATTPLALAGQGNQPQPMSAGNTPPQAAINACANCTQGAICAINTPKGSLEGICMPVQDLLACIPERKP